MAASAVAASGAIMLGVSVCASAAGSGVGEGGQHTTGGLSA